jgi:hypothetical protein
VRIIRTLSALPRIARTHDLFLFENANRVVPLPSPSVYRSTASSIQPRSDCAQASLRTSPRSGL